jgi:Protein of unknown function (DUF3617)
MKKNQLSIVLASAALATVSAFVSLSAHAQLDMKGKMKEGMYETTVTLDMPGMPKGANKPMASKHCVTKEDLEKGKGDMFSGQNKGQSSCEMKNVKQTSTTASYDMICPKEGMEMSTQITFTGDSMKGLTTTKMTGEMAKKMPPQFQTSKSSFETKFLGACTK